MRALFDNHGHRMHRPSPASYGPAREWASQCGIIPNYEGACLHTSCRKAEGKVRPTEEFNGLWEHHYLTNFGRFGLRTAAGRSASARLYWALKRHYLETGEFAIMSAVWGGLAASAD